MLKCAELFSMSTVVRNHLLIVAVLTQKALAEKASEISGTVNRHTCEE